jgi:hypothetical protein
MTAATAIVWAFGLLLSFILTPPRTMLKNKCC